MLFDQAGVLSKKIGKRNHDECIRTFDHKFTMELVERYQKFRDENTILPKD